MKLSQVFESLTYGELRQQGLGGFEAGGIEPEDYAEVVSHINLGLQALHTRFCLREKSIRIILQAGKKTYTLTSENSLSTNPSGFIQDTVIEPFVGDILKIESISSSTGRVPVNDLQDCSSIFLNAFDELTFPNSVGGEEYTITYRASPDFIVVPPEPEDLNLSREVPINQALLEPLLIYVAYRVQKGLGSQIGTGLAVSLLSNFEVMCDRIDEDNLLNNSYNTTNIKPELNHWV